MSGAIQEITNPFLTSDMTQDAYERLVALGIAAWNAVLLPHDQRQVFLRKMTEQIEKDADKESREIFEEFIELLWRVVANYFHITSGGLLIMPSLI